MSWFFKVLLVRIPNFVPLRVGRIVRTLVRVMYGGALNPGTLQEAESLFRRAIAIRPTRLIHRVELGKLLADGSCTKLLGWGVPQHQWQLLADLLAAPVRLLGGLAETYTK